MVLIMTNVAYSITNWSESPDKVICGLTEFELGLNTMVIREKNGESGFGQNQISPEIV